MSLLAQILVAVVALIHLYIVLLEMLWWRTPRGRAAFGTTQEFADSTAVLAANQGLYNGFLVAGLVWGLVAPDPVGPHVTLFVLGCVAVAGIYGSLTSSRKILFVQTVPAVLAGGAVLLS